LEIIDRELDASISSFTMTPLVFDSADKTIFDIPAILPNKIDNVSFIEHVQYVDSLLKRAEGVPCQDYADIRRKHNDLLNKIRARITWTDQQKLKQWHQQFPAASILDPCAYLRVIRVLKRL
jgi:hypothetical protein